MTKKQSIDYLKDLWNEVYNEDSDGYNYAIALDMAIEVLSADAEWIPCSERLPSEKDGSVLVTKRGEVMIAIHSEFSDTWYLGDMCAVGGEDPIAWMPLPKPYKGGDAE